MAEDPKKRIQHFNEFHEHLPKEKQRLQGADLSVGHDDLRYGQRMPPAQSGAGVERPGIYRQLAAGLQPPEEDQQFPRVHFQSMPCLV